MKIMVAIVIVAFIGVGAYGVMLERDRTANLLPATSPRVINGSSLTAEENLVVAKFNSNVANTVVDDLNVTSGSSYGLLLGSMDDMIRLTREKPDAIYETNTEGKRMLRQVMADEAGKLEKYEPALAKKLELTIQTLPAPS